jgi:simple sugar transport system ATP-binding protein
MAASETTPVLELSGIAKHFLGVHALRGAGLRLFAGEVHALMGQNGAGKSTLIKVLTGVHSPDGGTMRLAGRPVAPRSPLEAQRLGISTVYQEVNLCPNLTVAENVFAGRYPRKAWRIDWKAMNAQARELLARLNLDIDVTRLLSAYPVAVQQMVAIARALSVRASVLILDEPTSSLDADECSACSRCCAGCATRASRSCSSPTSSSRCTRWPIASPCCATASWSAST